MAFILGLVSSLHCVGMCGPIAMMIPNGGAAKGNFPALSRTLVYNAGRITTYAIYGLVFGLVGRSFAWFGWQQKLSIAIGLLIILYFLLTLIPGKTRKQGPLPGLMTNLRSWIGKLIFRADPGSLFGLGLLNGLLPCGMVYLALAGAIATGTALQGAGFMALFGLGTLPAMAAMGFFGSRLKPGFRPVAQQVLPAMMVVMATLLILRGLNLGIPYISPSLNISGSGAVNCHD